MNSTELREKASKIDVCLATEDCLALLEQSAVALESLQIQSDAFECEKEEAEKRLGYWAHADPNAEKIIREKQSRVDILIGSLVSRDETIKAQSERIRDLVSEFDKKNQKLPWLGSWFKK